MKPHTLTLLSGPHGPTILLNGHRIAGPKPWNGGTVMREWEIPAGVVEKAVGEVKE